ncbi:MAG: DinB family protein [Vicinamibacterales bacterium]
MNPGPYAKYLEGRDPVTSLVDVSARIVDLVDGWTDEQFERRYGPGKWTARQLLLHLVHCETVFSDRIRFALTRPGYVITPFDQDPWMALDPGADARSAVAAYVGLRGMTLSLVRALTPAQRATALTHPEFGPWTVEHIITALAGHERHHLPQFELIAVQP